MADESEQDRHRFTRRLEAFSDIVFGFALAQSAFALEIPKTADGLFAKSGDLLYFAITFILIGSFWIMHYRVFHYAFAARWVDVTLNFVLLAAVALLPFVLRLSIQFQDSVIGSAGYAAELGVGFSLLAALEYRGLRALGPSMTPKVLHMIQRAYLRHAAVGVVFLVSLPIVVRFGLYGRVSWAAVPLAMYAVSLIERARARSAPATAATADSS
jgi:uncharacterized membrane protein